MDDDIEYEMTFSPKDVATASKELCKAVAEHDKPGARFWGIVVNIMAESRIVRPTEH